MATSRPERRLSATDASFYYAEHDNVPMHIGGVDILEGSPTLEALRAGLDARMHLIPRYRQCLVPAPFSLGHPTWEDDPDFNINNHVVAVTCPEPGTEAQLQRLAGELFGQLLDREQPLWRLYLIEGLEQGRSALLWLIHHCMVDGVSGAELLNVALDPSPDPPHIQPKPYEPAPLPDERRLLIDAAWDGVIGQIDSIAHFSQNALKYARSLRVAHGFPLLRQMPALLRDYAVPVERFPFNVFEFSGERRLAWGRVSFAEARAIRNACGGTVNDVVLTALSGAMHNYLTAHGVSLGRKRFRVMVPVSLRQEHERGKLGNLVSLIPVDIPLHLEDPIERLQAVTERTNTLKDARAADLAQLAVQSWQNTFPAVQALAGSAVFHPWTQRVLNLTLRTPGMHMVCTNVPGPQIPLYALGHKVLAHYPLLPVAPGMGLNMGVFSYNHYLHFGFIADTAATSDVDTFARLVNEAFYELRTAAGVNAIDEIDVHPRRHTATQPVTTRTAEPNGSEPIAATSEPSPARTFNPERAASTTHPAE